MAYLLWLLFIFLSMSVIMAGVVMGGISGTLLASVGACGILGAGINFQRMVNE